MHLTLRSFATKLVLLTTTTLLAQAQTTVLTFEDVNGGGLLHGYGDRVDAASSGGYTHQGAGTFTPNVLMSMGGVEAGPSYCGPAVANTSAGPAAIRASGQTTAGANDLQLVVSGLPFGSVGFFLTSQTQGFVAHPAGSAGNLCLGGAIGRFIAPGQIRPAGTTGTIGLRVDLTRLPSPTGTIVAQPGQVWRFQAWYRDSVQGVATSNFTDAVAVTLN